MNEHAIYSPSSAHRWAMEGGCSASADAIAKIGDVQYFSDGENEEGTRAHDEIERVLGHMNGLQSAARFAHPPIDIDHPAAFGVALVVDFVSKLLPGVLYIEQHVRLTDDIWGRCDVAHWHAESRVLTIIDYKNGYVGVDAIKNEQLRIYAAAIIRTYNLPAEWIRYVVVQPNDFRGVPPVKQWPEPVADLNTFVERIVKIPASVKVFVAGEQCTYCPLFGRCEASKDVLARLGVAMAYPADQIPDAQFALFSAMEKPIADWFKAADKFKLKAALAPGGKCPPGTKLVTGQTKRAWIDEAKARAFVVEKKGVDALDPPSPAQAEKLGLDITGLAHKPPGGPQLGLLSDTRPVWAPKTAAEMFKGVPTT